MGSEVLRVTQDELLRELAADLGRGGYVLRPGSNLRQDRYFDKSLVLSRPGLVNRAAKLLAKEIPGSCERIAVTGVPSAVLGTALSQATGVPLLYGTADRSSEIRFDGESYRGIRAVLLEDVVFTGEKACRGIQALEALGADVVGVICLLDREIGGAQRIAEAGQNLRALFRDQDLVDLSHGAGV